MQDGLPTPAESGKGERRTLRCETHVHYTIMMHSQSYVHVQHAMYTQYTGHWEAHVSPDLFVPVQRTYMQ